MSMPASNTRCPVCGGPGRLEMTLRRAEIRRLLGIVFGAPPPDTVDICDYALHDCDGCGLVYASPMRAGDEAFYRWVTGFDRYVARRRWEWRAIRTILARETRPMRLLEIGCGEGAFLRSLGELDHVSATGIDQSERSVGIARARGLDAHRMTIDAFRAEPATDGGFDAIVATHVLEHLEDPLGFVRHCAARLNSGGCLLFSTPYSPLSRELLAWDVMNMPPHHLTRWNARAFGKLAELAGLEIAIVAPRAAPALKRAVRQTCIKVTGADRRFPLHERVRILARNGGAFREVFSSARNRERLDGRPAPDKVLVRLSGPAT